jgi:DNA repair exonuclease SbcCD ATPase subunit
MNNSEQKMDIPEDILEEIKNLVEDAEDDDILEYANRNKSISKGFRLEHNNVPTFRKKIISSISPHKIDHNLGILGSPGSLFQTISNFSLNTIDRLFTSFIVVMGAKFLSTLLLDPREEIRAKVWDYLDESSKIELPEREIAEQILLEHLIPSENTLQLFEAYRIQSDEETSDQKAKQQDCEQYQKEIAELTKKLSHHNHLISDSSKQIKKAERKITKLKDQIEKQQQKEQRLLKRIESESEKMNEALADQAKLQDQHNLLKKQFDEKLRKEIEASMKSRFNRWLTECEAVEKDVERQDKEMDPLMAEAEVALQRQRERDRHTGNRLRLHNRVKELQEVSRNIKIARAEALNPHEELRTIKNKVDAEINRISELLGLENKEDDELIAEMCARINEAELSVLNSMKNTLDAINDLGIYSIEQLIPVYKCYTRRMSTEYAAFTTKDERVKSISNDPMEWLWRCLQGSDDSLILILDGYNIIGRLESIFKEWSKDYEAVKDAREDLISRIEGLEGQNLEIVLFFDSPSPDKKVVRKGFKIIYSGGGEGKNRADEKIVDYLKSLKMQNQIKTRVLVTDDRELRQKAQKEGAKFIPVPQFAELLENDIP